MRGGRCTHSTALLRDAASNCRLTMSLCYHFAALLHATADLDRRGRWSSSHHRPSPFFCLLEGREALHAVDELDVYPPLCVVPLFAFSAVYACNVHEWLDGACAASSAAVGWAGRCAAIRRWLRRCWAGEMSNVDELRAPLLA